MSDISIQVLPVLTKSEDIEAYRNYALEWKRNGRLEICKEMKAETETGDGTGHKTVPGTDTWLQ